MRAFEFGKTAPALRAFRLMVIYFLCPEKRAFVTERSEMSEQHRKKWDTMMQLRREKEVGSEVAGQILFSLARDGKKSQGHFDGRLISNCKTLLFTVRVHEGQRKASGRL